MDGHIMVEDKLQALKKLIRELAVSATEQRERSSYKLPLRDMSAWSTLRAAQAWIAEREPPRIAWQGERIRRTALQIGYRRPVIEGQHRGLTRPLMAVGKLTQEVAVFEEGIVDRPIPSIAATLIHEATHIVTREIFCERYGYTQDEAFIVCDVNDREVWKTVFTAEALAFWNEGCWMVVGSPEDIGEGGRDRMLKVVAHALMRPAEGTRDLAYALASYTDRGVRRTGLDIPLMHLDGPYAGQLIDVCDLAPSILNPLLDALHP